MNRHQLTIVLLLLGATACQEKKAPQKGAANVAAAASARPQAPVAEAPPAVDWTYSAAGKRDPFRSPFGEIDRGGQRPVTLCNTPLGKFDLDQLKLVAVVTGLEDPVAMVEGPNGVGYALHRGTCIGRVGGVVSVVRTGEVVVAEWIVRADGTREQAQNVLRLPKEVSLEIEE